MTVVLTPSPASVGRRDVAVNAPQVEGKIATFAQRVEETSAARPPIVSDLSLKDDRANFPEISRAGSRWR
jgi:hypothetical protein